MYTIKLKTIHSLFATVVCITQYIVDFVHYYLVYVNLSLQGPEAVDKSALL